jgi:3-phenylpropionate/trans-cinnamate dioxygenase ferredoxin reductase subunit
MRAAGYTGKIALLGEESHIPYERPALSKSFLLADQPQGKTSVFTADFYASSGIDLHTSSRVAEIDFSARRLRCESGATVEYDNLLIATGSRARLISVPGSTLDGVHYLRSLDDTLMLRSALTRAEHVVVIGGGFLGLEVAASARTLGLRVTVLERDRHLLPRVVPHPIGDLVAALHRGNGVDVRCDVQVACIEGKDRVSGVTLESGETIAAEAVFVAVGSLPNVELTEPAGLASRDGIRVNKLGRTEAPNVYATGDVMSFPNSWAESHVRLESWQVAQNHAVAVGRTMSGENVEYDEVPWFWSDQFRVNIQIAGLPGEGDEVVYRGEVSSVDMTAFYFRDRRLVGSIAFNNGMNVRVAQKLMGRHAAIDPSTLVSPETKLRSLL